MEHQAVQVDRHDRRRADRRERLAVAEPARAVVPAAFGARAQVAVDLVRRTRRHRLRGRHVLEIRLVARRIARVPVAVQHRAVGHRDHMARGPPARRRGFALHPVRMFLAQCRQVFLIDLVAFGLRGERDHVREERRPRAARVVRAVAVRDVPDRVDQMGEVVEHVVDEILAARHLQPEHREIGVPVVAFAEAAAGHDIRLRQRDQRAVRRHRRARARELRPQPVDAGAASGSAWASRRLPAAA